VGRQASSPGHQGCSRSRSGSNRRRCPRAGHPGIGAGVGLHAIGPKPVPWRTAACWTVAAVRSPSLCGLVAARWRQPAKSAKLLRSAAFRMRARAAPVAARQVNATCRGPGRGCRSGYASFRYTGLGRIRR
jgi:hypothetical protein